MSSPDEKSRAMARAALLSSRAQQSAEQPQRDDAGSADTISTHQAKGARPSDEELWNWMHQDVSAERAEEIRSHLAYDAELYETWRQLRIAHEEIQSEAEVAGTGRVGRVPDYNGKRWWQVLLPESKIPYFGAAATLGLMLLTTLVIRPLLTTDPSVEFWDEWQSPKTGSTRSLTPDELAVLRVTMDGMRRELEATGRPPVDADGQALLSANCQGSATCQLLEQDLLLLGASLTKLRTSCVQNNLPGEEVVDFMQTKAEPLSKKPVLGILSAQLQQLMVMAEPSDGTELTELQRDNICNAADAAIERVLLAR